MEDRVVQQFRIYVRSTLLLLLIGIVFVPWGSALAQGTAEGTAVLSGRTESDRVGSTRAYPDGQPDLTFLVTLPDKPADVRVQSIAVRRTDTPQFTAVSSPSPSDPLFIGVADSATPGLILNRAGNPLDFTVSEHPSLLIFLTGVPGKAEPKGTYEILVNRSDGKAWTIPVRGPGESRREPVTPAEGEFPVRMSAILKGISRYDAVGASRTIKGDDKGDGLFVLTIETDDKVVSAIEIRNTNGMSSVWDTIPGSGNPPIGVARVSEPIRLLNNTDGSVEISVRKRADLNLYVADNGSIRQGDTEYRVSVTFSDGEIAWCPVKRSDAPPERAAPPTIPERKEVNFLGRWLGYFATDAVGPYPGLRPDTKGDGVFSLDLEIEPRNVITGIEIQSMLDSSRRWSTDPADKNAWGLGVAYQDSPRSLLNRKNGSIRIPVEGRSRFYLYAADPGGLDRMAERLRIVIHLEDNTSYQQIVRPREAAASPAGAGSGTTERRRGLITCNFPGFTVDLVNASTRPGRDGYPDGTFILRVRSEDVTIKRVDLASGDGRVRWSSSPKPSQKFLGVALYPKIYDLVNPKGKPLDIPVSGRRTLYLYAADDGLLSDERSELIVTVILDKGAPLSEKVIK